MWARRWWVPVVAFVAVAAVAWIVVGISVELWWHNPAHVAREFPHRPYLDGWVRWDSGWYLSIVREGYFYRGPDVQSSVAFFPAYPVLIRALDGLVGNPALSGILITFSCGLAVAVMFYGWAATRIGIRAARFSLAVLLLYPFSYYLFGAIYSDALFMAATLGAFLLLEADRPLLAGLAGAIATASRPVGIAVSIGLVIRALERRGALVGSPFTATGTAAEVRRGAREREPGAVATEARPTIGWFPRRFDFGAVRFRDAGVLLSVGGLLAYLAYLRDRFGNPLVFAEVERAWGQSPGIRTWLKADVVDWLLHPPYHTLHGQILVAAPLTFAALALIPFVVRRFGWGYAAYALTVVLLPAVSTKDFVGLARYVLVAFPCLAVVGAFLSTRRVASIVYFSICAALLLFFLLLWSHDRYVT